MCPKCGAVLDVVAELETRYLPVLRQMAADLQVLHPSFRINAGSGPVGSLTAFQGHNFYVEADRPGSDNPEPNCVALEICVRDLLGTPILCSLGVSWGGDGIPPCGNLDLLGADLPFGPSAVAVIDRSLPSAREYLTVCLSQWAAAYPGGT
jgi:hypothetical protein